MIGHRHFKYGRSLAFRVKHLKKSEGKLDCEDGSITIIRNVCDHFLADKAEHPRRLDLQHVRYLYVKFSYLRKPKIPVFISVSTKLFITTVVTSTGSDNFMEETYLATNTYRNILYYIFIYLLTTISFANIELSDCLLRGCTVTNESEFA